MKHSGGIRETGRHHLIFKVTKEGVERCLPLVALMNANNVLGILKDQFSEKGMTQRLEGWIDQG